jgi:hypothetical protein
MAIFAVGILNPIFGKLTAHFWIPHQNHEKLPSTKKICKLRTICAYGKLKGTHSGKRLYDYTLEERNPPGKRKKI